MGQGLFLKPLSSWRLILRNLVISVLVFLFVGCSSTPKDPFLWLEDIEGEKALTWVEAQNEKSLAELSTTSTFESDQQQAYRILSAKDRLVQGELRRGYFYNFWQDEKHVRGLWRRQKESSFRAGKTRWQVLIDVDKLSEREKENWVFKGSTCYKPNPNSCLVRLSRGGKDASVYREFDVIKKQFVKGGFVSPEGKFSFQWLGPQQLLAGIYLNPSEQTASGYPRVVRRWTRGQAVESAEVVFQGQPTDVGVWPYVSFEGEPFVVQATSFFEAKLWELSGSTARQVPIPLSSEFKGVVDGQLIFQLRKSFEHKGQKFVPGTLLSADLKKSVQSKALERVRMLFTPGASQAIADVEITPSQVFVNYLEDVRGRLVRFSWAGERWVAKPMVLPKDGSFSLVAVTEYSEDVAFTYSSYLQPDRQYFLDASSDHPQKVAELPQRFSAKGLVAEQAFAVGADGVKIPYTLIGKKEVIEGGPSPTVLYSYGGFEVPLEPKYLSVTGKLWVEQGGVFVVANIRGGGEYGPTWHQAALKENRQKAYDDFFAVSEDLIRRKVTTPSQLGAYGGSNGGLLMGVAMTQRPDLYKAIVCAVPLLDMFRFNQLLAGASWVGEYGDPANSSERKALLAYSPYHNLDEDKDYPKTFFVTSTKDDRVHPGHARKMVAKLEDMGKPYLYFENTEGGHAASANQKQQAKLIALRYSYFKKQLGLGDDQPKQAKP